MVNKLERAFSLGYRSALAGRDVVREPFDTNEEATAFNEGFQEAIHRLDDLRSDVGE